MKLLGILALLVISLAVTAQDESAEVLLFGVFHFANPGLDEVKVDQVDVTTAENQAYLGSLAERICAFRPTLILLEFNPLREAEVQAELQAYLQGQFELSANEIHQIGFRVARSCGVTRLYSYDEQGVQWNPDPMFELLEREESDLLDAFNQAIAQVQQAESAAHQTLNLRELLLRANNAELDRQNKHLYLVTNAAGAGNGFEGADATARWWQRNFRMFANIQRYATAGERVLVIGGQGHTAILRDLLEIDSGIIGRDIEPFL